MSMNIKIILLLLVGYAVTSSAYIISQGNSENSRLGSESDGIVGELRDKLAAANDKLANEQEQVTRLTQDNEALSVSLKETQEKLNALTSNHAALKSQLDALLVAKDEDVTEHNSKVASVVDLIAKLKEKGEISAILGGAEMTDLVAKIKSLGEEGIKAMNEMLNSEDAADRILAAQLLMNFDDPSSIAPLESMAMEDDDEMAKRWASQALLRMKSEGIEKTLRNLVENADDPGVKVNSLFGLCKEGNDWGLQNAIDFVKDDGQSDALKSAFLGGILMLKSDGVSPIVDSLVDLHPDSDATMRAAIRFYKNLGTPLGTARLQSMSANGNLPAAIRTAALAALN